MKKGKELDAAIENELQLMLVEGFDKSPISPTSLHDRLLEKGVIKGGLSTLTPRKELIEKYTLKQIEPLKLKPKDQQRYVNHKTREALIGKNGQLQEEIQQLERQLSENTNSLIEIIKEVRVKTTIHIDHLLSTHIIREMKKQ